MKTKYFAAIGLLIVCLFNIYEFGSAANEETVVSRANFDSASTKFGIKLFKQIFTAELPGQENRPVNILISPVGISMALSMVYNGADGNTKKEMEQTLELAGLGLYEINFSNKRFLSRIDEVAAGQISIANSLWINNGSKLKKDFVNQVTDSFDAEIANLDLQSPQSAKTINSWVSNKTGGKIKDIVDRISENTVMLLINAVYFKSNWAREFKEKDTKEKTFYMLQGKKKHPMMRQYGTYRYFSTDKFQTIALPYRAPSQKSKYNTSRFCFYIFLPNKGFDIKQFCDELDYNTFNQWMKDYDHLRLSEGEIILPKFTFLLKQGMISYLTAMGMEEAFNPQKANFTKMTAGNAWISEILHQTFIDVNEQGTEAAAVTRIAVGKGIGIKHEAPPKPFKMVVDRPFFFVIRDDDTKTILFMGTVMEPTIINLFQRGSKRLGDSEREVENHIQELLSTYSSSTAIDVNRFPSPRE